MNIPQWSCIDYHNQSTLQKQKKTKQSLKKVHFLLNYVLFLIFDTWVIDSFKTYYSIILINQWQVYFEFIFKEHCIIFYSWNLKIHRVHFFSHGSAACAYSLINIACCSEFETHPDILVASCIASGCGMLTAICVQLGIFS